MPKLNLYEDCGSLNNFVEQYLNERLDPFLRNEPSTILAKSNVSARELANQSYLNTANAIETFTGELQIAIADYLEDHEAVEWPKEYYRVHMTKTLSSGGRGAEFDREANELLQEEMKEGLGVSLLRKVKPQQPSLMKIEKEYNDLERKYLKFTNGGKHIGGHIISWIFYLTAYASVCVVLHYVSIHQYPRPLVQWLLLIFGGASWLYTAFMLHLKMKGYTRTREEKKQAREMERELKRIRRSEEYKTALRRRSEMPQRIERWQKEMANAIKQ